MEEEIEYILNLDDKNIAVVLSEITRIDGTLISGENSEDSNKVRVVCKIRPETEKQFVEWLKKNKISY